MIKCKLTGTIKYNEVLNIVNQNPSQDILIVIENTKGQNADTIELIGKNMKNVTFSVTGGLSPKKEKFNNLYYQRRTYLNPMELSKIIKIYEKIERGIEPVWTDTQKAMYVYKKLCDNMIYDSSTEHGTDVSRSLTGLIYKHAVCSGFALIYKEAMDRLGFENYYQNREGLHSWNIVKLDGAYRAFELTWDTCDKGQNGCEFYYFNRDSYNFYDVSAHDLSNEPEEHQFDITPYTRDQLINDLAAINHPRVLKIPLIEDEEHQTRTPFIKYGNGEFVIFIVDNDIDIKATTLIKYKKFQRNNGSSFIIVPDNEGKKVKDTFMYNVDELIDNYIQSAKIYTELQLESISDKYNDIIANNLLSTERLKRKINNFNGYVGYVGAFNRVYYDGEFEKEELNIVRR